MFEPGLERLGAHERRVADDGVDRRDAVRGVGFDREEGSIKQRQGLGRGYPRRGREPEAGQLEGDGVDVDAVELPEEGLGLR